MSAIGDSWYGYAQNEKTVAAYIDRVNSGKLPIFRGHTLSPQELTTRRHILNLMCHFQTCWDEAFKMSDSFGKILSRLKPLAEDGLVSVYPNHLEVTDKGRDFIRNICMCFDDFLDQSEVQNTFSKTV